MYYESLLKTVLEGQVLRAPHMKNEPAFYRRLEQSMDVARKKNTLTTLKPRWEDDVLDLTSSDFLSLSRTGRIRDAFLAELAECGDFRLSASGSRTQYGNYDYLNVAESEIAAFHNSETAWICHSGFLANMAVLESVPLSGDAIVWDEFSHASTSLGIKLSSAAHKLSFQHNSVDSLRDVLTSLRDGDGGFRSGAKSVLICVESIYSMDGDICPLAEFVALAKELFPAGNAQFIMDEAHSSGVLGPNGAGLVQALGLEKEIAIRIHVCSKALGATGGVILCNQTVRNAIIQNSRALTYSGAPSVPMVACIRAAYRFLRNGETQKEQEQIQTIVKYFFEQVLAHPVWQDAMDAGLLAVPLAEEFETRPYQSHIAPLRLLRGGHGHEQFLFCHLAIANMNAYPISYPTVPKGTDRIRLVFHAHNTADDVDRLVATVADWAEEMMQIESSGSKDAMPSAMRKAYWMETSLVK
ncbi:aminotransferase class I II [Diaporthe amygdali]|uniref:aminotransferase class I II n=1 Tax=Phomopsis amygdali TaxID=1214568 RepID=UPI0022FF0848|nr:aminotransferase class I II [Diaporthe amygdali]KAJ0116902.1 aminotransferase class I II [Diaporthe amygdali]